LTREKFEVRFLKGKNIGKPDPMTLARMQRSRDGWRKKAIHRGRRLKERNRQLKKWKGRTASAEARAAAAESKLAEERLRAASTPVVVNVQVNIQVVAVLFFIFGVVSCRAVSRLLKLIRQVWQVPLPRIPHHSSVVNWVCRAGLGLLSSVASWESRPWVAIIDTSISYAQQKLLVVLRAPLDHFVRNARALALGDVECIGIEIREVWNGESVCQALTRIFAAAGSPAAIIKDGGGDIGSGTKAWCNSQSIRVAVVRDIGHVIANELKRVYTRNPVLARFLTLVDKIRHHLCQTELASLRPPRLRTKGRFQSISRVAEWAQAIILFVGGRGRVDEGSTVGRCRKIFAGLSKMRWLIERMARDCIALNQLMELLKNRGLNQETYAKAKTILLTLPDRKGVRKRLLRWLDEHIRIQCLLGIGQMPLIVSTDVIESLMGLIKMIIERTPVPEFGRMALAVPLLCGVQSESTITQSLAKCPQITLKKFLQGNINNTIRKQKAKLLAEIQCDDVSKPVVAQPP
jgi:hypothetical protein